MLFRSFPLDGGLGKCGRGFIGGLLFVVFSCGLGLGTGDDCHVGFGLVSKCERAKCTGDPVVVGHWGGRG